MKSGRFFDRLRAALARERPSALRHIGGLIKNRRRLATVPILKLASQAGLSTEQWHAIEEGRVNLPYSTLRKILDQLCIPLREVFGADEDDFYSFVRATWSEDVDKLSTDEAAELAALYQEVCAWRSTRSKASRISDSTTKKKGP